MNTLILKGSPATGHQEFHSYIKNLEQKLSQNSGTVQTCDLAEMIFIIQLTPAPVKPG